MAQLYPVFGRQCLCRRHRVGRWYSWEALQSTLFPCCPNYFRIVGQGSQESFFSMMVESEAALRVQDIRVVCDYADVFLAELPSIPPECDALLKSS
jgi:hypothetical protein